MSLTWAGGLGGGGALLSCMKTWLCWKNKALSELLCGSCDFPHSTELSCCVVAFHWQPSVILSLFKNWRSAVWQCCGFSVIPTRLNSWETCFSWTGLSSVVHLLCVGAGEELSRREGDFRLSKLLLPAVSQCWLYREWRWPGCWFKQIKRHSAWEGMNLGLRSACSQVVCWLVSIQKFIGNCEVFAFFGQLWFAVTKQHYCH